MRVSANYFTKDKINLFTKLKFIYLNLNSYVNQNNLHLILLLSQNN